MSAGYVRPAAVGRKPAGGRAKRAAFIARVVAGEPVTSELARAYGVAAQRAAEVVRKWQYNQARKVRA